LGENINTIQNNTGLYKMLVRRSV